MNNTVPDFQTLMFPFLATLKDGKQHSLKEIIEKLYIEFNLTEEAKNLLVPSGTQSVIRNRIGWARTYIKKAGLISSPSRASFVITDEGKTVINSGVAKINVNYLKKFPKFQEWIKSYSANDDIDTDSTAVEVIGERTPSELIDSAYKQMLDNLAFEVLERLKELSDKSFEIMVLKVLKAMGYGSFREDASEHSGKPNDGGIDGIIKEDKLGLDTIYVQAKHYKDITVPISHIRDFAGSLLHKKAKKGVFITLSSFPQNAYDYVNVIEPKIVLINGKDLAKLMIDYNVGVSVRQIISIKDLDNDFFDEL